MFSRRPDLASAVDLTVEGTYAQTDEGFLLLTVGSATGTDAPASGDTAWAIEAEGYALMLVTGDNGFIPMIESGSCPTGDLDGNWVIARKRDTADATDPDGDYFGVYSLMEKIKRDSDRVAIESSRAGANQAA